MKMLKDMLKQLEHEEHVLETKIQRMLEESEKLTDELVELGRARKKLKQLLETDNDMDPVVEKKPEK